MKTLLLISITFLLTACASLTTTQAPMSDTHLHFNWDQEELVSAKEAVNILNKHNIKLAVVTATPSANALK